MGFNPMNIKLCKIWGGSSYIGADIYSSNLGIDIILINVYGPCQNWGPFWEQLLSSSLLQVDNLFSFFPLENRNISL